MLNLHNYPAITFPENFIWGSATAAHQIEGDDIHSINWRDQTMYPKFCQEAVDHYVDLLRRLKEAGIHPFVTISHGSDPAWFWDRGGFADRRALHYFERYVDFIVPILEKDVDFWMTINEINIMERPGCDPFELRKNYMICHAKAFRIIRKYSKKPVGAPHAVTAVVPKDPHFEADKAFAAMEDWIFNGFFYHALRTGELVYPHYPAETFPEMKDSFDFWAINYYTRKEVSSRTKSGGATLLTCEQLKLIDKEFYMSSFYPEGLYNELQRLKDRPVYITENGCCCADDRWRIVKLCEDLSAIRDAMDSGVDIRGYLHWSLMDNYEWVSFIPRLPGCTAKSSNITASPRNWLRNIFRSFRNSNCSADHREKGPISWKSAPTGQSSVWTRTIPSPSGLSAPAGKRPKKTSSFWNFPWTPPKTSLRRN